MLVSLRLNTPSIIRGYYCFMTQTTLETTLNRCYRSVSKAVLTVYVFSQSETFLPCLANSWQFAQSRCVLPLPGFPKANVFVISKILQSVGFNNFRFFFLAETIMLSLFLNRANIRVIGDSMNLSIGRFFILSRCL